MVAGSGTLRVEPRPVPAFSQIVQGANNVDVEITRGPVAQVEISGDDNVVPLITTTVTDNRLEIGTTTSAGVWKRLPLKIRIVVPTLRALDLNGHGDVQLTGIDTEALQVSLGGFGDVQLTDVHTDDLEVSIGGHGNVRMNDVFAGALGVSIGGFGDVDGAGRAGRLDVSIGGHGDVRLAQLPVDDAKVECGGHGNIEVTASRALDAELSGHGDIVYHGEPRVRSRVSGHGDIKHQ
jgi:hypothetical protein